MFSGIERKLCSVALFQERMSVQLWRTCTVSELTFTEYMCETGRCAVDARVGDREGPPSRGAG